MSSPNVTPVKLNVDPTPTTTPATTAENLPAATLKAKPTPNAVERKQEEDEILVIQKSHSRLNGIFATVALLMIIAAIAAVATVMLKKQDASPAEQTQFHHVTAKSNSYDGESTAFDASQEIAYCVYADYSPCEQNSSRSAVIRLHVSSGYCAWVYFPPGWTSYREYYDSEWSDYNTVAGEGNYDGIFSRVEIYAAKRYVDDLNDFMLCDILEGDPVVKVINVASDCYLNLGSIGEKNDTESPEEESEYGGGPYDDVDFTPSTQTLEILFADSGNFCNTTAAPVVYACKEPLTCDQEDHICKCNELFCDESKDRFVWNAEKKQCDFFQPARSECDFNSSTFSVNYDCKSPLACTLSVEAPPFAYCECPSEEGRCNGLSVNECNGCKGIGDFCDEWTECGGNAYCNTDTSKCECNDMQRDVNGECKDFLVGDFCVNGSCGVMFECSDDKCICPPGVFSGCSSNPSDPFSCETCIGVECTSTSQCGGSVLSCIGGQCVCPQETPCVFVDYYENNKVTCVLPEIVHLNQNGKVLCPNHRANYCANPDVCVDSQGRCFECEGAKDQCVGFDGENTGIFYCTDTVKGECPSLDQIFCPSVNP